MSPAKPIDMTPREARQTNMQLTPGPLGRARRFIAPLRPLVFGLAGCLAAQAHTADAVATVAFVKPPAKLDASWRDVLCKHPGIDCQDEDIQLYAAPKLAGSAYFAILPKHRQLAQLDHDSAWRVSGNWSFDDYRHSAAGRGDGLSEQAENAFSIEPALYPLGQGDYAVALVYTLSEGFAGGAASYDIADFISLNEARDYLNTPAQADKDTDTGMPTVFTEIPLSCSKGLRACFSEREYKQPHCSEDSSGHLDIRYQAAADGTLDWALAWHETYWPPHKPASYTKKTVTRALLRQLAPTQPQDGHPDNFPLCHGGPVS